MIQPKLIYEAIKNEKLESLSIPCYFKQYKPSSKPQYYPVQSPSLYPILHHNEQMDVHNLHIQSIHWAFLLSSELRDKRCLLKSRCQPPQHGLKLVLDLRVKMPGLGKRRNVVLFSFSLLLQDELPIYTENSQIRKSMER